MDVVVRIAERKLGASLALNLLALAGSFRCSEVPKIPIDSNHTFPVRWLVDA
jgi:hypothetical protein